MKVSPLIRLPLGVRGKRGFSLVEVALALGVISFGMLSLMGLVSTGLDAVVASKDLALEANIGRTLITEARQTPFSNLSTFVSGSPVYFDGNGNTGTQVSMSNYIYKAVVTAAYDSSLSLNGSSATSASATTASVASLTITVTKISNAGRPRLFSVFIANNGL